MANDNVSALLALKGGSSSGGSGLTDDVKQALLDWCAHTAFTDQNGQTYYDNLMNALHPIQSIAAVYTQSGTVYDTDSLDSLKTDLVVTATYEDGTSAEIPAADYTLSGTLTAGTTTITVSYGGKTATFDVTVTSYWDFEWNASSGSIPSGMVYTGTPTFNSGLMTIVGEYSLDFNYAGDCIIEVEIYEENGNNNNSPQICVLKAEQTGAKIILDLGTKRHYVGYNIESGNLATNIKSNEIHSYRMSCKDGVLSAYCDGELVASGSGAISQYMEMTGIWSSANQPSEATSKIKSIKFRRGA